MCGCLFAARTRVALAATQSIPRVVYLSSIAVVMMAMVAIVTSTPVIPRVSVATVIIRIRLGIVVVRPPVIPIGIIIVARGIAIIAARESKADSANSGKSGGDLSVSTLPGNESQSAYRQSN